MKTALEILNETVVNGFKSDRMHELTIIAMQSYALQVAEAVRDECMKVGYESNSLIGINKIDLTTFIK